MGRRFTKRQRAALYLASGGNCAMCGVHLGTDWHADHITPHAAGGATDMANGQALCPQCNLSKGSDMQSMDELRQWQRDALADYDAADKRDFLVCATPGAGKTTFALAAARHGLDRGDVDRIAVVVHTDNLRQQWADAAASLGIQLKPVEHADDYMKSGYHGYVTTYQQLAVGTGADGARMATRRSTFAIIDEIHHAGESRAWGRGLAHALEKATRRLALTGTPWREDKASPIPFVCYDGSSGEVQVDAAYSYGQAVAEGVCRPVEFHAYDGEARWRDCGEARAANLGEDLPDDDLPAVLDAVLHPEHEWMPGLLTQACTALDEIRQDMPDAGGLVLAASKWHADQYGALLERLTGEVPTIVVDRPEDSPKMKLDVFRRSRSRWLVAVKMVSEGIDIPRLALGVYASRSRTALFFRQAVGRFVRARPGEEINARLYIPAVPNLMRHAREIETELRHQLELEREQDERQAKDADSAQRELPLRESLGATEAVFGTAIYQGSEITPVDHARGEQTCREYGIPVGFASNMARLLRNQQDYQPPERPSQAGTGDEMPRHRREKLLRADINTLAGKVAYRTGDEKQEVNTRLLREGFPQRDKASPEQLEQIRDRLVRWLDGAW